MLVESQRDVRSRPLLPLTTRLGPVHLAVTERDRALAIWRDVVGLRLLEERGRSLYLGVGDSVLIVLECGAHQSVVEHTIGLYHVAIHVPARVDLAAMALRALQQRVRISPTDHLVSEAIYLWDLDGNGIEITLETPWRGRIGEADEGVYVQTVDGTQDSGREAIDLDDLLGELGGQRVPDPSMPEGTRIGHVHLHVSDLEAAMRFYRDGIGFGGLFIMRRFGMGDLGLDYPPHTIAFNVWAGPNARKAPDEAAGLRWFTILVPDADTLSAVGDRLAALGVTVEPLGPGIEVLDPSGNRLRVLLAG